YRLECSRISASDAGAVVVAIRSSGLRSCLDCSALVTEIADRSGGRLCCRQYRLRVDHAAERHGFTAWQLYSAPEIVFKDEVCRATDEVVGVSAKIELQCHRDFGRTAVVFGVAPGMSGLGHFAATAVAGLSSHPHDMFALGPRRSSPWPLPGEPTPAVRWIEAPPGIPAWVGGYTWLRWRAGDWTALQDRHLARWAANQLQQLNPDACFSFTQVGLEALRWCRARGI